MATSPPPGLPRSCWAKVYAAVGVPAARRALTRLYAHCAELEVPELVRLATTVTSWEAEVLAFHDAGRSNGRTEAVNLLIERHGASVTVSGASTTTASGSSCAVASRGTLTRSQGSGVPYHA